MRYLLWSLPLLVSIVVLYIFNSSGVFREALRHSEKTLVDPKSILKVYAIVLYFLSIITYYFAFFTYFLSKNDKVFLFLFTLSIASGIASPLLIIVSNNFRRE